MPALTTLGVKVEPEIRQRLQVAAMRLSTSPHALHKQALVDFLLRIERGEFAQASQVQDSGGSSSANVTGAGDSNQSANVFADLYRDVHPQSVLRAAINSAYRRPEQECVPLLLSLAEMADSNQVQATALQLVHAIRSKHKTSPVEAQIGRAHV